MIRPISRGRYLFSIFSEFWCSYQPAIKCLVLISNLRVPADVFVSSKIGGDTNFAQCELDSLVGKEKNLCTYIKIYRHSQTKRNQMDGHHVQL